ncbi:MAG: hypothetical protein ACKVP3_14145 [Hyphomicrobiaceae bacterium]
MPRLPTREEAKAMEEHRLAEVWSDIGTAEDAETFFIDLGTIINAELSLRSRFRIAEAMLAYSTDIRAMLDAENIMEAQRLVNGLRRESSDLQRTLARFEREWAGAADAVRPKIRLQAARECGAIIQNARQHRDQFESISRGSTGVPSKRLAEVGNAVWEAMWKIVPPFRFADCRGALADLNTVSERWTDIIGSQKGRAPRSKALSDMIERLAETFEAASGRSASGPRTRFQAFVKRIVRALPGNIYNAGTEAALSKRIRRMLADR